MHKKLLLCVCAAAAMASFGCNDSVNWKKTNAVCGNGKLEIGEACDGVTELSCSNFDSEKNWTATGKPACNDKCELTIGTCVEVNYQPGEKCGNGVLDDGEECDGNLIADPSASCATYFGDGASGDLSCVQCKISLAECQASDKCGNGVLDDGEQCDGDNFGGDTCASHYDGAEGDLTCIKCTTVDASSCLLPGECGDGEINAGEDCDGDNYNNKECSDINASFTGGELSCDSITCKFITTDCEAAPTCGNGELDAGEDCDSAVTLEDLNCSDVDSTAIGGLVACKSDCSFDLGACEYENEVTCGDGLIQGNESCEPSDEGEDDFNGKTCENFAGTGATGSLICNECVIDHSQCEAAPFCGDHVRNGQEECEDSDFNNATCESILGAGYTGNLSCNPATCEIITSGCIAPSTCGNNELNEGELCDTVNGVVTYKDDATCESIKGAGYTGELACNANCEIVDSACIAPASCGDNILNGTEACETVNGSVVYLNNATCATEVGTGAGGTLSCANCEIVTSACEYCGDGTVNNGEDCESPADVTESCADVLGSGYTGDLSCDRSCHYDTSACIAPASCGDNILNGSEACESVNGNITYKDNATCESIKGSGYTGDLSCNNCIIDDSACIAPAACGDNILNGTEACENVNGVVTYKNNETCESVMGTGFSGDLSCNANCEIVTDACVNSCGNSVLDDGEACDKASAYNLVACAPANIDLSNYTVGSVSCSDTCEIVTNCSIKGSDDYTVTEFFKALTSKQTTVPNYGVSTSVSATYDNSYYGLVFESWSAGTNGAPNLDNYVQVDLKEFPVKDGSSVLRDAVVNNYDLLALSFEYKRMATGSPKHIAVTLYDGDTFVSVLRDFTSTNLNPAATGQIVFSVKGMRRPRIRINSYGPGSTLGIKNLLVTGLVEN